MLTFLPLSSCKSNLCAYEILDRFCRSYPIEGQIYHSGAEEKDAGYISEELFFSAFCIEGRPPRDFAVLLNRSVDKPFECGVFAFSDAGERERLRAMCLERIELLCAGEYTLAISGGFVFYAVVDDPERAEELFYLIVR